MRPPKLSKIENLEMNADPAFSASIPAVAIAESGANASA
jgi:hypothetical protein